MNTPDRPQPKEKTHHRSLSSVSFRADDDSPNDIEMKSFFEKSSLSSTAHHSKKSSMSSSLLKLCHNRENSVPKLITVTSAEIQGGEGVLLDAPEVTIEYIPRSKTDDAESVYNLDDCSESGPHLLGELLMEEWTEEESNADESMRGEKSGVGELKHEVASNSRKAVAVRRGRKYFVGLSDTKMDDIFRSGQVDQLSGVVEQSGSFESWGKATVFGADLIPDRIACSYDLGDDDATQNSSQNGKVFHVHRGVNDTERNLFHDAEDMCLARGTRTMHVQRHGSEDLGPPQRNLNTKQDGESLLSPTTVQRITHFLCTPARVLGTRKQPRAISARERAAAKIRRRVVVKSASSTSSISG